MKFTYYITKWLKNHDITPSIYWVIDDIGFTIYIKFDKTVDFD